MKKSKKKPSPNGTVRCPADRSTSSDIRASARRLTGADTRAAMDDPYARSQKTLLCRLA
jgi:hypothetical protein